MNIDERIKFLEDEINRLKQSKNIDDSILNKTGDFKIKIYDCRNQDYHIVSTFKEVFDFLNKNMNKTDFIVLDSYNSSTENYETFKAKNEEEFLKMINEIATYNAQRISSMDFGLCKRDDTFKYLVYIENDYLKFFYDTLNEPIEYFKSKMTEEEYWKKIAEGKKYRLKFN